MKLRIYHLLFLSLLIFQPAMHATFFITNLLNLAEKGVHKLTNKIIHNPARCLMIAYGTFAAISLLKEANKLLQPGCWQKNNLSTEEKKHASEILYATTLDERTRADIIERIRIIPICKYPLTISREKEIFYLKGACTNRDYIYIPEKCFRQNYIAFCILHEYGHIKNAHIAKPDTLRFFLNICAKAAFFLCTKKYIDRLIPFLIVALCTETISYGINNFLSYAYSRRQEQQADNYASIHLEGKASTLFENLNQFYAEDVAANLCNNDLEPFPELLQKIKENAIDLSKKPSFVERLYRLFTNTKHPHHYDRYQHACAIDQKITHAATIKEPLLRARMRQRWNGQRPVAH